MGVERNAPCPCGSGKKYKRCCLSKAGTLNSRTAMILFALLMLSGAIGIIWALTSAGPSTTAGRVWSPEHGHWHDVR